MPLHLPCHLGRWLESSRLDRWRDVPDGHSGTASEVYSQPRYLQLLQRSSWLVHRPALTRGEPDRRRMCAEVPLWALPSRWHNGCNEPDHGGRGCYIHSAAWPLLGAAAGVALALVCQ